MQIQWDNPEMHGGLRSNMKSKRGKGKRRKSIAAKSIHHETGRRFYMTILIKQNCSLFWVTSCVLSLVIKLLSLLLEAM